MGLKLVWKDVGMICFFFIFLQFLVCFEVGGYIYIKESTHLFHHYFVFFIKNNNFINKINHINTSL